MTSWAAAARSERMPTTMYYNPRGDDTGYRHKLTMDGEHDLDDDTWHDDLAQQCAKDWHDEKDGWEGE